MTDNTQDNTPQQNPASQPAPNGDQNSGQSNGATFTQAQVNEMVGKTRKEARETAVADVLKELGLTSKDELKATIEDARKRKEAEMSESDKAKAEAETERKAKESALAQLTALHAERRHDRIQSAFTRAATALKAQDTEDVWRYARDKHADELNALADESGAVDDKKVTALLEKIKVAKAVYFTPPTTTLGSMSNNGGSAKPSEQQAMKHFSQRNQQTIRGR